jgi:hypothetical protein
MMTLRERIRAAELEGTNPWPELIDDWVSTTGGTLLELTEEVADEAGDSAARMSCNIYDWHSRQRKLTGIRREALTKVLADALEVQSGLESEAHES